MKIWYGYGSEHSMRLVMIGRFKTCEDAKETHKLIENLVKGLDGKVEPGKLLKRFDDNIRPLIDENNCWELAPRELEQFVYDLDYELKEDRIIVTTDEFDVSAFYKLMILKGAKVEIYSAHDYKDAS